MNLYTQYSEDRFVQPIYSIGQFLCVFFATSISVGRFARILGRDPEDTGEIDAQRPGN